ncbi:MAG: AIR synthase related protein, partial [Planctomycetota bacterium]
MASLRYPAFQRGRQLGMKTGAWRVELEPKPGRRDPLGAAARRALAARGLEVPGEVRSIRGFLLSGSLSRETVQRLVERIFADPVTETARILPPGAPLPGGDSQVVVRRHPGVADPQGRSAVRAIRVLEPSLPETLAVETYRAFRVDPAPGPRALERAAARALANPTIESVSSGTGPLDLPAAPRARSTPRREVPLQEADGEELVRISREGGLALSLAEMEAIQAHFRARKREPTDAELETLAQTWSEHCKHKTLTSPVRLRERDSTGRVVRERRFGNLLKETVFAATERLDPDWCWSVFRDNAGVVALDGDLGVAVKVETHNHPSALEPYGGAGTGIGGVIRDILGTGRGARPFAATDVFCVGPRDVPRAELPPGTLHPDRILEGIVAGVRDYGNRMGIPTVCGTVLRHPGYLGNPLVFCGCLGEIP